MSITYEVWYNAETNQYETMKTDLNFPRPQKIAAHDHEAAAIGNLNRILANPSRLVKTVTVED